MLLKWKRSAFCFQFISTEFLEEKRAIPGTLLGPFALGLWLLTPLALEFRIGGKSKIDHAVNLPQENSTRSGGTTGAALGQGLGLS